MVDFENVPLLTFTLLVTVVIWLYLYFKKKYSYWTDRNVASVPTLPFIGTQYNLLAFKKNAVIHIQDIYNRFPNEKIIGGFKAATPELVICDPQIIRAILVKDFNKFADRPIPSNDNDVLTQNLFSTKGTKWRLLRQKMSPVFTSSKMKKMFYLILDCSEQFCVHLKKEVQNNDIQNISDLSSIFTVDSITSCAFGLKAQSTSDGKENEKYLEFRKIGTTFLQPSKLRIYLDFFYALIPSVMRFFGISFFSVSDSFVKFFVDVVKSSMGSRSNVPSNRHDLIDLMIELKNKGFISRDKNDTEDSFNGDLKITDELITAQAFVFFVAGFETSSTLISYVLYELALNPEVQKKLQMEIDITLEKYEGKITYESVQSIEYLEMVMNESLRKHPPLGVLSRVCDSKYNIPDTDVVIDKGVEIIIPIYSIHRDSKFFPEPEKFIPERFSSDPVHPIQPFTFLPFGDGPRNCIGLRFGKLQSAAGLVSILREFSVEPCKETSLDLKLEVTSVFIPPVGGLWLKFVPRK